VLFNRVIDPMVAWISGRQRFHPNWEVERIVSIPLASLTDPSRYGTYRARMTLPGPGGRQVLWNDFPCFLHRDGRQTPQMLWGATFRMTLDFLDLVFGFRPPLGGRLPVYYGSLDGHYLGGPGSRAGIGPGRHR
jgi:hypothetical protein